MGLILLIVLIALLIAALPRWPYSRKWGYNPSIVLLILLIIFILLILSGNIIILPS